MIGKMRAGYQNFWTNAAWQSRAHRFWFQFCAVCLSLYISYVVYFSNGSFLVSGAQSAASLVCFLLIAIAVYGLLLWACQRFGKQGLREGTIQNKHLWKVFLLSTVLSLFVLGSAFLACYPGGVSYDISNQWRQMLSGEYNNWHPVFHTLLVWLVSRISCSYSFVLVVQILAFSLAMGYLTMTLSKRGVPVWLALVVQLLVVNSAAVKNTLMYLGKDSAMSIGVLLLTAYAINMLFTQGEWLGKIRNALLFGAVLAFVTLVRHNGFIFTMPLLVFVGFSYEKQWRNVLASAALLILCLGLVQGPLYGALDVVYPSNFTEESIGIPMTIMANAKKSSPETLDVETNEFLGTLATNQEWQDQYQLNNYNSIKFTYDRELIAATPMDRILRMTINTAVGNPRLTFTTINEVTGLVWSIKEEGRASESVRNSGDLADVYAGSGIRNTIGSAITKVLDAPMGVLPLRYLFDNFGVALMILLLATLWSLYRGGVKVLTLAIPTLLYALATMLLLCGHDSRFFHFIICIAYPTICAMLYMPKQSR
ncbi:MAG: hypothetical protein GX096_11540 [Clostridiales bacterium]|nr:hypothetical protein [Clostridiales bacterium]